MKDFFARAKFLCCTKESAEKLVFTADMPSPAQIKAPKAIIIVKAREEKDTEEGGFPTGIDKEVVFMEINKPILENLYNICQVSPHLFCSAPLPLTDRANFPRTKFIAQARQSRVGELGFEFWNQIIL